MEVKILTREHTGKTFYPDKQYGAEDITDIYVDGGLLGSDLKDIGCPDGGTFACVFLAGETEILRLSGIVLPGDKPGVTNNASELVAAQVGLSMAPYGWSGTLHTDSICTIRRLGWFLDVYHTKDKKTPPLRERLKLQREVDKLSKSTSNKIITDLLHDMKRMDRFKMRHLDGHPSPIELEMGLGKRGNPVSIHNKTCDEMATEEKIRWQKNKNQRP